jgi:formylglycine-generating enzyme required for sulfatase activity/serine/threonine protein kinase
MSAESRRDPLGIAGTIIADKYRMGHVVGEGGFSVVYKAEHTIWQQPVAIKCFKILANAPEDQRDRLLDGFIQEGKLMAQLSSRSAAIVQARDIGTFTSPDGQWIPYMVLEWLEGKPLDVVLWEEKRAGLPGRGLPETLAFLEPAAIALELAHSRGIAHRDLKPANFFVLGDPRGAQPYVKVLDFGIAKVMADHAAQSAAAAQTGNEITSFTPQYGAPEQFSRTHGATGPWTDVFAMALILVEVLRGGEPALDGGDFMQMALVSRDPQNRPTPRSFGVEVPEAVEQVFRKALAVAPADRYPSIGQLWNALVSAVFPDAPTWSVGTSPGAPARAATGQGMPASQVTPPRVPSAVMPPSVAPSYPGYQMPPAPPAPPAPITGGGTVALGYANTRPSMTPLAPGSELSSAPPAAISAIPASRMIPPAAAPVPASSRGGRGALIGAIVAGVLGVAAFGAFRLFGAQPTAASTPSAVPPASATAPAASASAAAPPRPTECPKGMVLVSGGRFFMGSDDPAFKLWQPAHKVTLDTFCIDVNEVTTAEYRACSDVGECKRPPPAPEYPKLPSETDKDYDKGVTANTELCNFGKDGRDDHPINCVSWDLSSAYCKVQKKRLPTEAEWEYAARGSDGRKFPWGDDPGGKDHMNAGGLEYSKWELAHGLKPTARMYDHDDGFVGTAPVGSFPKGKTKFGANDFVGNVWEWTADAFETYKAEEQVNPRGAPAGERKVIRGGGFNGGTALWLNPAFRYHQVETARAPAIGFRCALTL